MTPTRLSDGCESYNDIKVQAIQTTIPPDHEDYALASEVHNAIGNISKFSSCLKDGEVLHITDKADARNVAAFGDCEHQLLFERMDIEAPCLVIDGDLLIGRVDLPKLDFDHSMLIGNSSMVYIHNVSDKSSVLKSEPEFIGDFDLLQNAHLNDGIMWRLYKLGYVLSKK